MLNNKIKKNNNKFWSLVLEVLEILEALTVLDTLEVLEGKV